MTPGNSGGNDKEIEAIPPGNRGGNDKEIEAIPPLLACTALLASTLMLTHRRACEGRSARGAARAMRVLRLRGRVRIPAGAGRAIPAITSSKSCNQSMDLLLQSCF